MQKNIKQTIYIELEAIRVENFLTDNEPYTALLQN